MNPAEARQTRWFVLVCVAAAAAFLLLVAMEAAGIGRTILK
ncbi:MAG: hypothetical protein AB1512_01070 [Thermodesulfobacteriota bacterium]